MNKLKSYEFDELNDLLTRLSISLPNRMRAPFDRGPSDLINAVRQIADKARSEIEEDDDSNDEF